MLWSNTNKVGCGLTEYKDGKWFAKLYTCDYAPAGNFINGQMYKIGKACSSCPKNMRCSNEYPGLCGKNEKVFLSSKIRSSPYYVYVCLPVCISLTAF